MGISMTREEKDLLLKDLCSRVPYGVKVQYANKIYDIDYISSMYEEIKLDNHENYTISIIEVKPYLFPLSSMTEEQKKEFIKYAEYDVEETVCGRHYEYYLSDYVGTPEEPICNCNSTDWCNKNNFDYRGLIEKGLALDATGLNIY